MALASLAYALSSLNGTKHGSHLPVALSIRKYAGPLV